MEQVIRTSSEMKDTSEENWEENLQNHKTGPNSKRSEKKWTNDEDELLLLLASNTEGKKWKWIASQIPNKRDSQCRSRWERIKPGMKMGRWSPEEDKMLVELIQIHGDKWSDISKCLPGRTGKQVRDRYKNIYDPNLTKEGFTQKDDELIYKLFLKKGPKWKEIKESYFLNRSVDFIKNRFYSNYKKFEVIFKKSPIHDLDESIKNNYLENNCNLEGGIIKLKLPDFSQNSQVAKNLITPQDKDNALLFSSKSQSNTSALTDLNLMKNFNDIESKL